jgi:hypothetical protein
MFNGKEPVNRRLVCQVKLGSGAGDYVAISFYRESANYR